MVEIVLDTNFAVAPFNLHVDIYDEMPRVINGPYELVFPKICLKELSKLKDGKISLGLMKAKGVKFIDIPLKNTVDDSIIIYTREKKGIIATQDAELRKKALKNSLSVIIVRKKQFLKKIGGE